METTRIQERIRILRNDLERHERIVASIQMEIDTLQQIARGDTVKFIDLPIDDLGLSVRATLALKHNFVKTIKELTTYTDVGLLKLPTFGKQSLTEVKRVLEQHNLYLGMKW